MSNTRNYLGQDINTKNLAPSASESQKGLIEIATTAEAKNGTNSSLAMTPNTTGALFPFRGIQVYDTAGTYTWNVPAGVTKAWVIVTGGGAAGSVNASGRHVNSYACSGSAGGTSMKLVDLTGVTSVSITVGAGGVRAVGPAQLGGGGESSSFGSFCSATGALAPAGIDVPGSPGVGAGGDINLPGGTGTEGAPTAPDIAPKTGVGGASYWGGGLRSGVWKTTSIPPKTAPGSGGAGSAADSSGNSASTPGMDGIVTIQW